MIGLVPAGRISCRGAESVEHLTLRIVSGKGWNAERRGHLENELRRHVGPSMQIEFEEADELERAASGKYRMVISEVPIESGMRTG